MFEVGVPCILVDSENCVIIGTVRSHDLDFVLLDDVRIYKDGNAQAFAFAVFSQGEHVDSNGIPFGYDPDGPAQYIAPALPLAVRVSAT